MTPSKYHKIGILGGTTSPTYDNNYLARDGLYYNGYPASSDCAEDSFGECMRSLAKKIEQELKEMKEEIED